VPRDLDAIVRQAMAADPADRFQTVQAMAAALSRSAAGVDGPPAAEFLPVPPAPTGPEVMPSRGFLRHEGRLLGWVLGLVAVAAILVAVGLTLAKDDLGNLFGAGQTPGTSRSTATTNPHEKVQVESATSFDPGGDDHQENEDLARRAIDGDLTTGWRTQGYNQNFGPSGIKDGVGLVLDLGRSQEVEKLTLTLAPPGPSELTIYGSDDDPHPPTLEGWKQLADPKTGEDRMSFNLDGSHRFLLIWFTSLPQDDDGRFRGGVANVTLTS
jgi:hypothetical protein